MAASIKKKVLREDWKRSVTVEIRAGETGLKGSCPASRENLPLALRKTGFWEKENGRFAVFDQKYLMVNNPLGEKKDWNMNEKKKK